MLSEKELTDLLAEALAGNKSALPPLVNELAPVVRHRVARTLLRAAEGGRQGADLRQNVDDFTQEVFLALFEHDAKALRFWDATGGLSLRNFVGLIAEHQAASILRTNRRSPWKEEPTIGEELDRARGGAETTYSVVSGRELLTKLLDRLRGELTPLGSIMFELLWVEDRETEEISKRMRLNPDAVYQWKCRIIKLAHRLNRELQAESDSKNRRAADGALRSSLGPCPSRAVGDPVTQRPAEIRKRASDRADEPRNPGLTWASRPESLDARQATIASVSHVSIHGTQTKPGPRQ